MIKMLPTNTTLGSDDIISLDNNNVFTALVAALNLNFSMIIQIN